MTKKLKYKFVATNMFLIIMVLILIFASMYATTYNKYKSNSINAMKEIANAPEAKNTRDKRLFEQGDYTYFNRFYIMLYTDGRLKQAVGYSIDTQANRDYIQVIADAILDGGYESGKVESENLRYYVKKSVSAIKIVFLDMSDEQEALRSIVGMSAFIGIISLIASFGVSWVMASLSISPIERSLEQQKQLVSNVSHELKTPLTIIRANADIMMTKPDSTIGEEIKSLEYIKNEVEQMTTLVNNMLFLAKTDEDKQMQMKNAVEVNFSDTLMGCSLAFETVCFESGRELVTEISDGIRIIGDESAIKQLVTILLDNACKYSEEQGRIFVKLVSSHDKAVFTVNNGGTPIPDDELPHVFERFYRVEKSRNKEKGGYGIGLAIAKSIVDAHRGKITMQSNTADGTTVTVTFNLSVK